MSHRVPVINGEKRCPKCATTKPADDFSVDRNKYNGLSCWCLACTRSVQAARRERLRGIPTAASPKVFLYGLASGIMHPTNRRGTIRKHRAPHNFGSVSECRDHLMALWEQQGGRCAYSGQVLTTIRGTGRVRTNASVDRLDPKLPYVPGNICLCTELLNRMKTDQTDSEFKQMCRAVLAFDREKRRGH